MNGKAILKKFLSFSIGNWVVVLISLISTPILTRILTPDEYGIYALFLVVINLFVILSTLGLDQSYIRFYFDSSESKRIESLKIGLVSGIFMFALLALLIIGLMPFSGELLFGTDESILLIAFIFIVFFSIINRYNYVVLRMEQKAKLYSTLQVVQKVVDFLVFLLFYYLLFTKSNNLYLIILAYAIATSLVFFASLIINKTTYIELLKSLKKGKIFSYTEFKALFVYGFPLGLTVLITWVFQYIDRFMLSHFMSAYEVGIYAAAFKFVAILSIVQTSFTTFWVPLSNQNFSENPDNKRFFEKIFEKVLLAMILLGTFIVLFKNVFILFFGTDFALAVDLLPMLIFIPIMYTLSEITVVGINFMKKSKYHVYISIAVCVLSILLSLILIPCFGIKGAAVSTALTYTFYFTLRTYIGMRLYSFKILTLKNILLFAMFIVISFISFI